MVAKIREKQQARAEYEAAKSAGKSARCSSSTGRTCFEMNVANILPGDEIEVELRYTELVVPTDSVYEFVFPTVVGPRYVRRLKRRRHRRLGALAGESLPARRRANRPATFTCTRPSTPAFRSRTPRRSRTACMSPTRVPARAAIELLREPANGPNRDFILRYQLAGAQASSPG